MKGQELHLTPLTEKDEKERPAKKGWEKEINARKKLVFIWEYCKYVAEYRPTNKTAF